MNDAMLNQSINRCDELKALVEKIWSQKKIYFEELVPSRLKTLGAVYIIALRDTDEVLYVGRTKDLKRRLYTNHLMGNESTARLKKYLTKDNLLKIFATKKKADFPDVNDRDGKKVAYQLAKDFIKEKGYFRFIEVDESRNRGLFEAGLTYALNTKFLEEEH